MQSKPFGITDKIVLLCSDNNLSNRSSVLCISNRPHHVYGCQMTFSKIPNSGSGSVCGTKYWAIYTCIVLYYYHFYTGQKPDNPLNTGHLAALTMWAKHLQISSHNTSLVQRHRRRLGPGFGRTKNFQFWGTGLKNLCVSLCVLD